MATETKATDFPASWDNPADGDLSWRFDPMHTPDITTPLSFDLYMEPFIRGFGMLRLCHQNYYVRPPPSDAERKRKVRDRTRLTRLASLRLNEHGHKMATVHGGALYDHGGWMTGHAAVQAIRKLDKDGSIAVFSAEPDPPYSRPPLTKGLWTGQNMQPR